MVKYHDVWVIVEGRHRKAIESWLALNTIPGVHFVYYTLPHLLKLWDRNTYGYQLNYYLWQIGAYFIARKLNRTLEFDLVHHVTLVRYCTSSFLNFLPAPFIWGPVGGADSVPKRFWSDFSLRGKVLETIRETVRWIAEHDPFVRLTTRRSAVAIATTEATAERLRVLGARRVEVVAQIGLSSEEIEFLGNQPLPPDYPVRFISLAQLHHFKGLHLSLRAFAVARIEGSEYWIVGDGPERKRLQNLAQELGIHEHVRFWSELPRTEALSKIRDCHVLLHPSLRESGGTVCLEAMASRRPVICLNLGGPGIQVTEKTGFKVEAHMPDQLVRDLATAMSCLAGDQSLRMRMGEAGQRRVKEIYNWDVKGKFMAHIYDEILESSGRPHLTIPIGEMMH